MQRKDAGYGKYAPQNMFVGHKLQSIVNKMSSRREAREGVRNNPIQQRMKGRIPLPPQLLYQWLKAIAANQLSTSCALPNLLRNNEKI